MSEISSRLSASLAGRYHIERELGAGGMATVFLAQDLKHQRRVALKVLRPELAAVLGTERFLREIEVTAGLNHPHVLPLFDSGEADGFLYYVMPVAEGESLRHRLAREKQLPIDDAVRITCDIAEALAYAHSLGVVHRDVKPENILFDGGRPVLTDFGIAKAVTEAGGTRLTETGLAIGTPTYMSPEQASGDTIDGRCDVYALGCVLFEMLAGEPPYTGATAQAVLARKAADPVPSLSTVRETLPASTEEAIRKALAKVPADRYPTATAFRDALLTGTETVRPRGARARRVRWIATAFAAIALGAGAVVFGSRRSAPSAPAVAEGAIPLDSSAIAILPLRIVGADTTGSARALAIGFAELFAMKVTGEFRRRVWDPPSVEDRWRRAGGTLEAGLPEERGLDVARSLGAGLLMRGTVWAASDSLVVGANLVDVATGQVRVAQQRAEGTFADQQRIVDELIVQILARDAGYPAEEAPKLREYTTDAVQALLAARAYPVYSAEGKRMLRAALAADSSMVDLALSIYAVGENVQDTAELRYAWEHQDQLSEQRRAYLRVIAAGRHGPIRSRAEQIAGYEDLTRRWPGWQLMWAELGEQLTMWGALAGVTDWRTRARAALERVDPPYEPQLRHLTELAFLDRDTARAAVLTERYVRSLENPRAPRVWRARARADQWRLATFLGDAASARGLRTNSDSIAVLQYAVTDGRGVSVADLMVRESGCPWWPPCAWLWAGVRGNEEAASERWSSAREFFRAEYPSHATVPVYQALFLGRPADSVVRESAEQLRRIATGESRPRPTADQQATAVAWTTVWRLTQGELVDVDAAIRLLRERARASPEFDGWAWLIEVLRVRAEGGDVRGALLAFDSVVRPAPLPSVAAWPSAGEVHNLLLTRLLAQYGDSERALAAVRRRPHYIDHFLMSLPAYLREEGRLAAAAGDTAGALRAYEHYLALREDPDPPWRAQWDSVRTELAALVAQ